MKAMNQQSLDSERTLIMTPAEYESQIATHFDELGYRTRQTAMSGDYGVDVFAENADERLAIQVKMYGTARRVNRQMVMELHGAKDYFDCDRAVIATDGELLPDAREVTEKLGIQVLTVPAIVSDFSATDATCVSLGTASGEPTSGSSLNGEEALSFDQIWTHHVMPLAGQLLRGKGDRTNFIDKVDWAGVWRTSSTGRSSRIDIEIFRLAINHILRNGSITRDEINQNYAKRASSGVVLILSQVPMFELTDNPLTLSLRLNNLL
ncbi:restriction endonuclease [Arthrobacter sunyaminii]|uniref:restriction endonuclease n=1 Tax=Arthrobacter sunyaminii TaxID=2816859 RepID=UPI001A94A95E|nr:restriction endonuclease [Arthrobacter sunyaminii]MBO0896107.1 restriction endonuclease [Arthrobacter sunyaminii]